MTNAWKLNNKTSTFNPDNIMGEENFNKYLNDAPLFNTIKEKIEQILKVSFKASTKEL